MSLVKCPECGRKNVSDCAHACPSCGYDIKVHYEKIKSEEAQREQFKKERLEKERLEREKLEDSIEKNEHEVEQKKQALKNEEVAKKIEKNTPKIIAIILVATIALILIIIYSNHQMEQKKLDEIESLVNAGNYTEAWKQIDSNILNKYRDVDYIEKAIIIGNMEDDYVEGFGKYGNGYLRVILRSIGAHQKLLDWGLYEYTEKMVLDSVQQIENTRSEIWGDTVEEMIYEKYNDPDSSIVEPYRTDNPSGAKEYIQFLIASIDEDEAEQYKENEYNKNNPLQITSKSVKQDGSYWYCNGTLSNLGTKSYTYVKVKVTYYDKDMTVLTTDWTYAVDSNGIKAGENQQFEIMTKVIGDVEKYKVEVIGYQ